MAIFGFNNQSQAGYDSKRFWDGKFHNDTAFSLTNVNTLSRTL
jgi:hypothetical protein